MRCSLIVWCDSVRQDLMFTCFIYSRTFFTRANLFLFPINGRKAYFTFAFSVTCKCARIELDTSWGGKNYVSYCWQFRNNSSQILPSFVHILLCKLNATYWVVYNILQHYIHYTLTFSVTKPATYLFYICCSSHSEDMFHL